MALTRRYSSKLAKITACAATIAIGFFGASSRAAEGDTPAPKAEAQDSVSEREEVIVVGSVPTPGFPILPATESEFRFKLSVTGQVVTLRWADMEENERRRVQKIYGLEMQGAQKVIGDKVTGTRYHLTSGKTLEGLPIPERDRVGWKAIRTATSPLLMIPEADIKSKDEYEAFEGNFYSPLEIYQKWLMEKPPSHTDASAHLAYAQRCANISLFGKALEHLQMAAAIDPRTEERNKDFKMQLIEQDAKQQAQDLYDRMMAAKRSADWYTAWNLIDQLDRNFPNSDLKSRWDAVRPQIEAGTKTEINKRVVQMSYSIASDLIQQKLFKKVRVDEKGNLVPSMPGKQVTTRFGHIFRGTVESAEPNQPMVIICNNIRTTIAAKDIMSVQDVDLSSAAKEIAPAWDDLKDYITDISRPDGLKMQMIAKMSQMLKQPEAKIKEIFDARLNQEATYKDGVYSKTDIYVTLHDAYYGKGTWLRDGMKPVPYQGPGQQAGNRRNNNNGRRTLNGNNNNNNNNNNNQPQFDPDDSPDTTDDPNIWWKFQSTEQQLSVLRAMAAEKIFSPKEVQKISCQSCKNTGMISIQSAQGGRDEMMRCPTCRGIGVLVKVTYR